MTEYELIWHWLFELAKVTLGAIAFAFIGVHVYYAWLRWRYERLKREHRRLMAIAERQQAEMRALAEDIEAKLAQWR